MAQNLAHIALVVADYDEAIAFYTEKLNFELLEDTVLSESKRWVIVAPKGSNGCQFLLAKAANDEQKASIGNQTGGRVFLFLKTDSFDTDYQEMLDNGINFIRPPKLEKWGKVAVFEDLYGNKFDLIQENYTTD